MADWIRGSKKIHHNPKLVEFVNTTGLGEIIQKADEHARHIIDEDEAVLIRKSPKVYILVENLGTYWSIKKVTEQPYHEDGMKVLKKIENIGMPKEMNGAVTLIKAAMK
jgi:hypothetical protein